MKVAIASDHAGFELKRRVLPALKKAGFNVIDLGAVAYRADDDYPDFALRLATAIQNKKADKGILICGSGVGACIAANKFIGIRAALAHDSYSAHQGVEHDAANVLCIGSRIVGEELAKELCLLFLKARFTGEARHKRRVAKVAAIEQNQLSRR